MKSDEKLTEKNRSQYFKTFQVLIFTLAIQDFWLMTVNVDQLKSKFSDKCFQFKPHFYTTK